MYNRENQKLITELPQPSKNQIHDGQNNSRYQITIY